MYEVYSVRGVVSMLKYQIHPHRLLWVCEDIYWSSYRLSTHLLKVCRCVHIGKCQKRCIPLLAHVEKGQQLCMAYLNTVEEDILWYYVLFTDLERGIC